MSWFDVSNTKMLIIILFRSTGVLFEGAFSLWVSMLNMSAKVKLANVKFDYGIKDMFAMDNNK